MTLEQLNKLYYAFGEAISTAQAAVKEIPVRGHLLKEDIALFEECRTLVQQEIDWKNLK